MEKTRLHLILWDSRLVTIYISTRGAIRQDPTLRKLQGTENLVIQSFLLTEDQRRETFSPQERRVCKDPVAEIMCRETQLQENTHAHNIHIWTSSTYTHIDMHIQIHTHRDRHTFTDMYTHRQTVAHIQMHTHSHRYTHTHTQTPIHTHTCTDTRIHSHICTHPNIHMHLHVHVYIHTETHAYTSVHAQIHTHPMLQGHRVAAVPWTHWIASAL